MKLLRRCLIGLCGAAVALGVLPAAVTADEPAPLPPLQISKFFDDLAIPLGGNTTLTIDLTNTTDLLTFEGNAGFTDGLPDGLAFLEETAATTCTGQLNVAGTQIDVQDATLGPEESCTTTVTVVGFEVGVFENTAASFPGGHESQATLTVVGPPTVAKAFAPAVVPINETTRLTITLTNPNEGTDLAGVGMFDNLEPKLAIADPPNVSNTCGGNVDLTIGTGVIELSEGAISAGSSCEVSLDVLVIGTGLIDNIAGAWADESGGHPNSGGAFSDAHGSVTGINRPLITKVFGANAIDVGGTTALTINVHNENGIALTGVGYSDTLPAGLSFMGPDPQEGSLCGGDVTRIAGTISLSGATVPAGGTCSIEATVIATAYGLQHNVTSAVTSTNGGTGNIASADLMVAPPPTVAKAFAADSMPLGGTVAMTFTFTNPNDFAVTGLSLSDTFPSGLVVATPSGASNTCGATFAPAAGSSSVSLSSGTIPANGSCTATVDVTATSAGVKTNTTGNVRSTNAGVGGSATDSITVIGPPVLEKSFDADTVPLNGTVLMTLAFSNPNPVPLTGVSVVDTLPAGLQVPENAAVSIACDGSINAVPGGSSVEVSEMTILGNGTCQATALLRATQGGAVTNTTGAVSSLEGGTGNTASASLVVAVPPVLSKSFDDASIAVGESTLLTFTVENPNLEAALSGVGFTDLFPAGLVAPMTGAVPMCGGTATLAAGSLSLANATIAAGGECSFSVAVQGTSAGTKLNTTFEVLSAEGGTGNTASASVVVVAPPVIGKVFGKPAVPVNGSTSLTFTVSNPNSTVMLSGVAFSDSLPSGLVVKSPNGLSNSCGGTATAVAGSVSVSLSGGSIPPLATCTLRVDVRGTSAGVKDNVSGAVTSMEGGAGNIASATLVVALPASISKVFGAPTLRLGKTTTLTFVLTNPNTATVLSGVTFADALPSGLKVASPTGFSNTCGGTVAVASGIGSVPLSGGTIPAGGSCTLRVNVTASGKTGLKTNVTTNVLSKEGGVGNKATATITIAK
jgi:uncharacterized repeat protein (TIGR01451 family)